MKDQPNSRPRRLGEATPQRHAVAFKLLCAFRLVADDLLEIVFPQELLDRIDWDSLECRSKGIRGVTAQEHLGGVGEWIMNCRTEAKFLARAEH